MLWENEAEKWFSFDKLDPELKELLIKIKEDKKNWKTDFTGTLISVLAGCGGKLVQVRIGLTFIQFVRQRKDLPAT